MLKTHPDRGSGRPGSLLWHSQWLNNYETIGEIRDYLKKVTGNDLDVDIIRNIAFNQIKEWLDDKRK
jgi:hypothetical protein